MLELIAAVLVALLIRDLAKLAGEIVADKVYTYKERQKTRDTDGN